MSVKTGSGRKLQWAIEIEQRSMWEASMWFGSGSCWTSSSELI